MPRAVRQLNFTAPPRHRRDVNSLSRTGRGYIDCARATRIEPLDDGSFSDSDDHASRPTAPYAFRVRTPGGKHGEEWMLQAASVAERDAWIQCLRGMMGAAAPTPRRLSSGVSRDPPREENSCALM